VSTPARSLEVQVHDTHTHTHSPLADAQKEAGITAKSLTRRGVVWQKFVGSPVMLEFHVFHSDACTGEPVESEEMAPKWFNADEIPYAQMWKDDEYWYPAFLERKCFRLFLVFNGTEEMLGHTLEEVSFPVPPHIL